MKLSDLTGEVRISAEEAKAFIKHWFLPTDKVCVVGRRSEKSGNLDTMSQSMLASDFLSFTDEFLESLIFGSDGAKWNLYFGVSPIKEDVSLFRRGTEDNVDYVPGVWADIDVKDKGFATQKDIIDYLNSLALQPSIIVGSGSGGVHAYWKLGWDQRGDKELVERWWSYLDESAGDRSIDKLIDLTRIMRIPGTVYFPKEQSGGKVGAVTLLHLSTDTYTVEQIKEVSADAFKIKHERRKRLISRDANQGMDIGTLASSMMSGVTNNRWNLWRARAELESFVNDKMTWQEILTPHGWTHMRQLRDGSQEWARPGRSERSAVVDFEDSPVMSLLSSSEETGLADLKDAHIPLTKFRVAQRLMFGDDTELMVSTLFQRLKDEGIL